MIYRKTWLITSVALTLGLFLCISTTQAELPYDITTCGSGTSTVIFASNELTIISTDSKGITLSNHEDKAFENTTYHCSGTFQIANGKPGGNIYCKFLDPDGDIAVGETTLDGADGTWKFLYGTGKWDGITGGGKNMPVTKGKGVVPGTSQGCRRATGTYQLP